MRSVNLLLTILAVAMACGCEFSDSNSENVIAAIEDAASKRDPGLCAKLKLEGEVSACYSGVALKMKDSTICGRIKDKDEADMCRSAVAVALKEFGPCLQMEDGQMKALCSAQVAKLKGDDAAAAASGYWTKIKSWIPGL